MKNKEKYFEEIIELFVKDSVDGICGFKKEYVLNNKSCAGTTCDDCRKKTREWLEQEYIEPIKLTKVEKIILENITDELDWIVRSKNGSLSVKEYKPTKESTTWYNTGYAFELPFTHLFQFIKWEDEEPYNIQELLENCEEV